MMTKRHYDVTLSCDQGVIMANGGR